MARKKINTEEILDLVYDQLMEDRETIMDSYKQFSEQIENKNDYAVNGANINKCLELLTKQTAQLLEYAKMQGAGKKKDEGLSTDDIYSQLKKESSLEKKS